MESLTEAPKASSFTPLAEHQSATPTSFWSGPPVLHYYSDKCVLIIHEQELSSAPALATLVSKSQVSANAPQTNGGDHETQSRKVLENIDVWVTSDKVFIYSSGLDSGLSIPYPCISLHAIQSQPEPSMNDAASQGVYMQLVSSNGDTTQSEDLEPESISITIVPTASLPPTSLAPSDAIDAELQTEDIPEQTPVAAMFAALSNCSNLHPDPIEDEEMDEDGLAGSTLYQRGMLMPGGADGGLPPPMPGSGGWITAENMHEYFDEEGNWIGPDDDGEEDNGDAEAESLGPGAGTTRHRDTDDMDGDDVDNEEAKWRRTE